MFDFLKPSHHNNIPPPAAVDFSSIPTALILLNNQAAFAHPSDPAPASARSNPLFEVNLTSLLAAYRVAREAASTPSSGFSVPLSPSLFPRDKGKDKEDKDKDKKDGQPVLEVVHVFHTSEHPGSVLHPNHPGMGVRPLDFATPVGQAGEGNTEAQTQGNEGPGSEKVIWKSITSPTPIITPELGSYFRQRGIRQLLIAGLTTDHAVSTTVRMAANMGLVDKIILVGDATATWAKAGIDAETVHAVSVASLEGEFVEVMGAEDVVKALRKVK